MVVLGSPLIRASDKAVIGLLSIITHGKDNDLIVCGHVSTNIHFYFDWISKLTGMDLPKCDMLHN